MPAPDPDHRSAATSPSFRIDVVPGEAQVILRLRGELDVSSVPIFTETIDALDGAHRSVLVDLADVPFIDSTGVGAVVHARRNLESRYVTMAVVNPSERARFVFELTGLSDLIITPS